jgi:hypothetical protein
MRLLVDTNIFLEMLLDQEKAAEAASLLDNEGGHTLFISDFTIHSIGLLLFRHKRQEAFSHFINDVLFVSGLTPVSLGLEEMPFVVASSRNYRLDFDDAYQYALSARMGLTVVSYDGDFDRTDRTRKTPAGILKGK